MQAACLNPLDAPPHADRILVVRLGALGDVVRTLPAVVDLRARYPRAHLAWLVERKAECAVRSQPGVDEVIVFPREELTSALRGRRPIALARAAGRFVSDLRRHRFDLVLDFHGILKSGVLAWLSGAPVRVGYEPPFSREGAARFATHRARIEPARISRFERNAALIDFLGIGLRTVPEALVEHAGVLPLRPDDLQRVQEALEEAGTPHPVVIHPGSSAGAAYKRYPLASWARVARALAEDGSSPIVACGPDEDERGLRDRLVSASDGAARAAPETPTFGSLAALFASSRLLLGSDSGPLHVASLVGTPVVQLLGPTDPVENRPWAGTPSRSLRVPVGCSPCRRGCPAASCMRLLPPESVIVAARELLAEVGADGS